MVALLPEGRQAQRAVVLERERDWIRRENSILHACCAWRECHGHRQRRCGENSSGEHELLLAAACVAAMKPRPADARIHW